MISVNEKFRDRYKHVHALVFQRSCEYALSLGDLFDILETLPELPFSWDQEKHKWVSVKNIISCV